MTPEAKAAYLALDQTKREIVRELDSAVVLAGPGSGKTATLAVKAAYLSLDIVAPPRGVACLTYSREAAAEFTSRLKAFGIHPSRRLFLGTVHGFCLGSVLRPFGLLSVDGEARRVATDTEVRRMIASAVSDEGSDENPEYIETTLTRIRRARAVGESVTSFSSELQAIAARLEHLLGVRRLIDFEGIVNEAVGAIRSSATVRSVLGARYPWILIDEYQDLGGPLHAIVKSLTDTGNVSAFVVGDPDQSIYGFTGASPTYLAELTNDPRFRVHRLDFNYRAGSALIAASEAVAIPGGAIRYSADPTRTDPGEIFLESVPGGLDGQADHVVDNVLPQLQDLAIPLHEIAILYPFHLARAPDIPDSLIARLDDRGIPYAFEREKKYRGQPFVRWLRSCASWAISPAGVSDFDACVAYFRELLADAGQLEGDSPSLSQRVALVRALRGADPEEPAAEWLSRFASFFELRALLKSSLGHEADLELLERLTDEGDATVRDFATDSRAEGSLVVGTYHGSKGRQFDAVVLPWLQQGVLPREAWSTEYRMYQNAPNRQVAEERRLLYVALTRARRYVFLISAQDATDIRGRLLPPSQFLSEIESRVVV